MPGARASPRAENLIITHPSTFLSMVILYKNKKFFSHFLYFTNKKNFAIIIIVKGERNKQVSAPWFEISPIGGGEK